MSDLSDALAAPEQPEATFRALERRVAGGIGAKLFTVLEIDAARRVARRLFSSDPEAYPLGGEKPLEAGHWSAIVLDRREPFVANTLEEIETVFADAARIDALGCRSCLNLPVVIGDTVVGTLNALHVAGHYTPERVRAAAALALPGALAFLVAARYPPENPLS